jgi:hypothetical protein
MFHSKQHIWMDGEEWKDADFICLNQDFLDFRIYRMVVLHLIGFSLKFCESWFRRFWAECICGEKCTWLDGWGGKTMSPLRGLMVVGNSIFL